MGNSPTKDKKPETNEQLQAKHRERQERRAVNIVLLGEDNAGKDTVCLQLIRQNIAEGKDHPHGHGALCHEQQQPLSVVTPSDSPQVHQMIVSNPHIILAALNNGTSVDKLPDDVKNLRFNLLTCPGKDDQRKKFWNENTFRQLVHAGDEEIAYADGLIFVIDASDKARVESASRVIHETLHQRHLEKCPMVIFANKQDAPGAMNAAEVETHLKLIRIPGGRLWCCIGTQALKSGQELNEGLIWLLENKPAKQQQE